MPVFGSRQPEHASLVGCFGFLHSITGPGIPSTFNRKGSTLCYRFKQDLPTVRVFNGDIESALRRFNRRVRDAGIFGLLKDRRLRPTGTMRKKHKRKAAVARLKKL